MIMILFKIEQTKDPSHKSHHNPCEMLYFWHTLLRCFNTLSLSVKVQYSNWMLLAVRGDVENKASLCWQQRSGVLGMLVVQSLNQSNLTSAHADCILFRPLKFGWSTTYIYILQSRRFLRPACNSHPFRNDAWPLKASKVQLNLPGDRAKNQARC